MHHKVLHVVESLDRGAVENWLIRMLRYAHKSGESVDWSFYCILGRRGLMDEEVRNLGAKVIYSSVLIKKKLPFILELRKELRRGKYDVLHSHHDIISSVYLLASMGLPIQNRIVHLHNADECLLTPNIVKQWLLREPMRRVCLLLADKIVGISNHTLDSFLRGRTRRSKRDIVHYYGVDTEPFSSPSPDRSRLRRDLDLPEDALILLFAGRVVPEKNPLFVIDVLAELRRLDSRAVAIFAGEGAMASDVMNRAQTLKVDGAVRMLGWREDLAKIMNCCDLFILPRPEHPMEGFGMAVVEAQLAGLRILISEGISKDPILPTASVERLALSAGPKEWAKVALKLLEGPRPSSDGAIAALRDSQMDMDRSFKALLRLYE